jgi:hypothetical protein
VLRGPAAATPSDPSLHQGCDVMQVRATPRHAASPVAHCGSRAGGDDAKPLDCPQHNDIQLCPELPFKPGRLIRPVHINPGSNNSWAWRQVE